MFFFLLYLQFILYFLVNQSTVYSTKLLVVKSVFFQEINISDSFDKANSYLSLKHNGQRKLRQNYQIEYFIRQSLQIYMHIKVQKNKQLGLH